jgi:hypothetical protein
MALPSEPTPSIRCKLISRAGSGTDGPRRYVDRLCEIGVLREVKAGREKLFIHPNLMDLLTAEDHKVPEYPL